MKILIVLLILAVALASGFNIRKNVKRIVKPLLAPANNPNIFITNGITAEPEQFSFQVGLSIRMSLLTLQWCGGSLISPEWILTAAHCTDGARSITAYLGSTKQRSGTKVKVLETIIHNDWNKTEAINDISLLRIATVTLGTNINIVNLPLLSTANLYLNEIVIATGWGYINDNKETNEMLQYAYLEIVPNSVCFKSYGTSIKSSIICGQGPIGVSTCSGDSGGPLVIESTKTLIGLTSFGAKNCTHGFPTAFTRITSYRLWILEQTGV